MTKFTSASRANVSSAPRFVRPSLCNAQCLFHAPVCPHNVYDPTVLCFLSPARLLDTRDSTSQRIHSELILGLSQLLLLTHSHLDESGPTRAILKSWKTPLPFPPIMHLFLICVLRV